MDPIANMFSLMNQATRKRKKICVVPFSTMKWEIVMVLYLEGYLSGCARKKIFPKKWSKKAVEYIVVSTKQSGHESASTKGHSISRISTPGCRRYTPAKNVAHRWNPQKGLGTVLLSTVHGILVGRDAKALGVGGELIASVF